MDGVGVGIRSRDVVAWGGGGFSLPHQASARCVEHSYFFSWIHKLKMWLCSV